MKTPAPRNGGLAALAAVLVMTATAADARIGGLNMGGLTMHGVTMTQTPDTWTRGYGGPKSPPPYAPPCQYGRRTCASDAGNPGGGGTGGFSPGGGSGTKPVKKPNLQ